MLEKVANDVGTMYCVVPIGLFWLLFVRFILICTWFQLKGSESGWASLPYDWFADPT